MKELKETTAGLIDVYGQNDHIFLLQIESHLAYLDQFARTIPCARNRPSRPGAARPGPAENGRPGAGRSAASGSVEISWSSRSPRSKKPGSARRGRRLREAPSPPERKKIRGLLDASYDLAYGGRLAVSAALVKLEHLLQELSPSKAGFPGDEGFLSSFGITVRELSDLLLRFRDRGESPSGWRRSRNG